MTELEQLKSEYVAAALKLKEDIIKVAYRQASEKEALRTELAAAREVIEQLDASTNKDEIDNAKSAAYEFLAEYPND